MTDKEKIKSLEKQVELLEKIIELQNKNQYQQIVWVYPQYPEFGQSYPGRPMWEITCGQPEYSDSVSH